MVSKMDGGEDYFCIDSKPIEVCRIARSKRCSMGKKDFRKSTWGRILRIIKHVLLWV